MSYEEYVQQQAVLISEQDLEEQKQEENRKIVYEDLLARFHLLQESLKDEQQKNEDLKSIVRDYIGIVESFSERVIEIPFSRLHNLFLLQARPTSLFLCVTSDNTLKWVKAPEEMNDQRIPS